MANEDREVRGEPSDEDLEECADLTVDQVDELFADDCDGWSTEQEWRALS